jgi:pyruvate-formate lyase-activating enzyme
MLVTDMAMVDVKAYDPVDHKKLTGMDNEIVRKNIDYLGGLGKLYEIRTVIVPDLLNNTYNVDSASKLLASINPTIRYKLIKYRSFGVREELLKSRTPKDDYMIELAEIAKQNGCRDVVIT